MKSTGTRAALPSQAKRGNAAHLQRNNSATHSGAGRDKLHLSVDALRRIFEFESSSLDREISDQVIGG